MADAPLSPAATTPSTPWAGAGGDVLLGEGLGGGVGQQPQQRGVRMRRLDAPFYPVTPLTAEGMLERSGGHSIYWCEAGKPNGMPVCVVHGGPGSGCNDARRRSVLSSPLPSSRAGRMPRGVWRPAVCGVALIDESCMTGGFF